MMLSNKRITKALIRLRGCAGWYAPLLFAYPEDRFSRVEVHIQFFRIVFFVFCIFVCGSFSFRSL